MSMQTSLIEQPQVGYYRWNQKSLYPNLCFPRGQTMNSDIDILIVND